MKFSRSVTICVAFIVMVVLAAVWLYLQPSVRVPAHWDLSGNAYGWMVAFWVTWLVYLPNRAALEDLARELRGLLFTKGKSGDRS